MIARSAPWPSSPAPSARREAALGLDRAAEQIGQPCRQWTLAMHVSIEGASLAVNARPVEFWFPDLGTVRDVQTGPSPPPHRVRREGKRRGQFLLLFPPPHPRDDFIHRSGSAGKRNVFCAGAVRHLAVSTSPWSRLFPLVVRSRVLAGFAEWHGHTCSFVSGNSTGASSSLVHLSV